MRTITRYHNIEIIKERLGYRQIGSSTLFQKKGNYLLSPAVSEGESGSYWIDKREVRIYRILK
jgi:hypothetical protein